MLVEIHMLQNYAPSNLNRDDTGSPKQCMFGGFPRARISSQCLKRSIRQSDFFQTNLKEIGIGIRTRKMPEIVKKQLIEQGISEEFAEAAAKKATGFGNKEGKEQKDKLITKQIMFFSPKDIEKITAILKERIEAAKDLDSFKKISVKDLIKKFKESNIIAITPDIALFGRMITSDAFVDIEASMQVAHAISTNKLEPEFDFFTAIDDESDRMENMEEAGAGMIGDVEYNSSCFYKYFSFDINGFLDNMSGSVEKTEYNKLLLNVFQSFLEGVIYSNPSGKQNTFAAHQKPSIILIEFKDKKIPVSYANAFIKPAVPFGKQDLIENSVEKFIKHVNQIVKKFNIEAKNRIWFASREFENISSQAPENVEICEDIKELMEKSKNALKVK